jgi:hypothetical protein
LHFNFPQSVYEGGGMDANFNGIRELTDVPAGEICEFLLSMHPSHTPVFVKQLMLRGTIDGNYDAETMLDVTYFISNLVKEPLFPPCGFWERLLV